MSASKISWRSKQSLGTATCLHHSQVAISTLLWGYGAMISDGLTKLSKREERRDVNYPKQTLTSALRIQDSSGVSDNMNTFINYLYSMGFCFSSSLIVRDMYDTAALITNNPLHLIAARLMACDAAVVSFLTVD